MDEQRLLRALRAGPPFATAYVAHPLVLREQPVAVRWPLRRLALLLALTALLLAGAIVGALVGGVREGAIPRAIVVRDPGAEISYTIGVVDSAGREKTIFPPANAGPVYIDDLAWSPGGEQLAFTAALRSSQNPATTRLELYVIGADGSGLRHLVTWPASSACPWSRAAYMRWSPDGRTIAICVGRGDGELQAVDAGNATVTTLASGSGSLEFFGPFRWSPDSEWLAYRLQRSGNELWAVRRDGSDARRLAIPSKETASDPPTPVLSFAWNADSDAVAFADREAGDAVIRIIGLDGTQSGITLQTVYPGTTPQLLAWDGDRFIYLTGDGRVLAASSLEGEEEVLLSWGTTSNPPWLAADGQIDWSGVPWVLEDGGTIAWWDAADGSACLVRLEGGRDAQPQFCIGSESANGKTYSLLAVEGHP